jgi:hypothetical protein
MKINKNKVSLVCLFLLTKWIISGNFVLWHGIVSTDINMGTKTLFFIHNKNIIVDITCILNLFLQK